MQKFIFFLLVSEIFLFPKSGSCQLTVDSTHSAGYYVQHYLEGPGITIFNVSHSGPANSIGSYSGPITTSGTGVVMVDGGVCSAIGPNNSSSFSAGGTGLQSFDPELTSLTTANIYDANILEFDFIPSSDTLKFTFAFGSEEYPEFVGVAYSDVVGFFISGPNPTGGNYLNTNFAFIPGTSVPISIDSINSTSYASYFTDNFTVPGTLTQFDGYTIPITEKIPVVCGNVYHLKLGIADLGDASYNSGIFLDGFSFQSTGTPPQTITGTVTNGAGPITSGNVVLFANGSYDMPFDSIQVSSLDLLGSYQFTGINPGNYIIKAFPDHVSYPTAIDTYLGNDFLWDTATVISYSCGPIPNYDITLLDGMAGLSGPGSITGTIKEGSGFIRVEGDPIPGIDVKLGKNPGGQMVISTTTDASGTYTFTNLPLNDGAIYGTSYTVYVDIPGLGRDSSYTIVLDAANPSYDSLNYLADSAMIHLNQTSISGISGLDILGLAKVFPNPSNSNSTLTYSLTKTAEVSVSVYSILGVKVAEQSPQPKTMGSHELILEPEKWMIEPGIYFIRLEVNGKASLHRWVLTE